MALVESIELIFSKFTALIDSLIYLHRESQREVMLSVEKQLRKRWELFEMSEERVNNELEAFCFYMFVLFS